MTCLNAKSNVNNLATPTIKFVTTDLANVQVDIDGIEKWYKENNLLKLKEKKKCYILTIKNKIMKINCSKMAKTT